MTIYNKSSHPIEVKKISIRLWSLRDEIEAAIERRMKECEASGVPLYIDDIKEFYHMNMSASLNDESNVVQLRKESGEGLNDLMESLSEESSEEGTQVFNEAEEIIAEQKLQGIEDQKPSPIIQRPFERQPPNLDKISYGFALLSDVNMETVLSFTKDKFLYGQSVMVEFLIPRPFTVSADVTYCSHYAIRSRIISTHRPDYRVQCGFTFNLPGEREALRSFLKSIEPDIENKKGRKNSEEDSLGL